MQILEVIRLLVFGTLLSTLGGCLVVKAVDKTADVAIGVTKGVVKTGVFVVDAAIPDDENEEKDDSGDSDSQPEQERD